MEQLGLLVGHLIGDYIVQTDWMASNKTTPAPVYEEMPYFDPTGNLGVSHQMLMNAKRDSENSWKLEDGERLRKEKKAWRLGHVACTVHCLCYTLAVWACSFWWMPWWGLVVCFIAHWPVDRFRLAGRWMRNVSGQKAFASGPLAPWSVIVVDNTFHIATLFLIGVLDAYLKTT